MPKKSRNLLCIVLLCLLLAACSSTDCEITDVIPSVPEPACTGDIILRVEAPAAARLTITDKDELLHIFLQNMSGKDYVAQSPVVERNDNGNWVRVRHRHANLGLVSGGTSDNDLLFLHEPLEAGEYRLWLDMRILHTHDIVGVMYEFSVVPLEDAPKPEWDAARLLPSPNNVTEQSRYVTITADNPVLDTSNYMLNLTTTIYETRHTGLGYQLEVLLDDEWFVVPFVHGAFGLPLLILTPGTSTGTKDIMFRPMILPAGQYRIVRGFYVPAMRSRGDTAVTTEFAVAEFTVAETLDWFAMGRSLPD